MLRIFEPLWGFVSLPSRKYMTHMEFTFHCSGHENILGTHKTTVEFTKDAHLTKNGDCIIGVNADFDFLKLKEFIGKNKDKKITAEISAENIRDEVVFFLNPDFSDKHEIVIRKTDFRSERTLGINSGKAAIDIKRELVERIKDKNALIKVILRAD